MKGLGLLLLMLGCSATGFWFANRCELRLRQLQSGIFLLKRLQREVLYASSLLEASRELESGCSAPYQAFLQSLQRQIVENEGRGLEQIWRESSRELNHSALREKEIQSWSLLGAELHSADKQMQQNSLQRLIEQWQDIEQEEKREWSKKKHLYPSLGTIGGILLCILLL